MALMHEMAKVSVDIFHKIIYYSLVYTGQSNVDL